MLLFGANWVPYGSSWRAVTATGFGRKSEISGVTVDHDGHDSTPLVHSKALRVKAVETYLVLEHKLVGEVVCGLSEELGEDIVGEVVLVGR